MWKISSCSQVFLPDKPKVNDLNFLLDFIAPHINFANQYSPTGHIITLGTQKG